MDSDFYTQFENNFRGSREQIMEVLSSYDGLIDYILNIDNNPSLLDIGSGRGEWIQKCNAKGFNSIGIELDSKMVHDCRNLNLNVKEGDALSLLDDFGEDSFSIVSAFHVIEHMNHESIKKLLIKCKDILKPHGLLIFETPSIDSLLVSTKSFHIDPTHINPIHPDLLAFMIKRTGFTKLKYYFMNGGPLQNADSDKLTTVLNGVAQDLVLIASKSKVIDNSIFDDRNLLQRDMRLAKTTLEAAIDFDNYAMNRYAQYDEAIFIMRKRIIELERQLEFFMRLYNSNFLVLFIKKLIKVKRKIFSLGTRIKKLFFNNLNNKLYIFTIERLYKVQSIFFILRNIEKMLDKLGLRIYQSKLVRRSKRINVGINAVAKHNRNLQFYFKKSEAAKNIFKDFDKDCKL